MNLKQLSLFLFLFLFIPFYIIVYGAFTKSNLISLSSIEGKNIFLDSKEFNEVIVSFLSNEDLKDYHIHTVCNIKSSFLKKDEEKEEYFFKINFLDNECKNNNFYLSSLDGKIFLNTMFQLNFFSYSLLINKLTDFSSDDLRKIRSNINKSNIVLSHDDNNISKRKIKEFKYLKSLINEILIGRKSKYKIPIEGKSLPNGSNLSKFPNSRRPYRENYTDGIHGGWDIDANFNDEVVSLDDGIIIYIVSSFNFNDFNKLKTTGNITNADRINNLNILRGNQVWVKTMKGDVAFYSHLNKIHDTIKVGEKIKKGDKIGRVGITGVPDKNYNDYHLHFELHKNIYDSKKAGDYSIFDYMNWDWYYKGKDVKYIIDNQYELFEK